MTIEYEFEIEDDAIPGGYLYVEMDVEVTFHSPTSLSTTDDPDDASPIMLDSFEVTGVALEHEDAFRDPTSEEKAFVEGWIDENYDHFEEMVEEYVFDQELRRVERHDEGP